MGPVEGWRSLVGGWASAGADKPPAEAACYETPAAWSGLAPWPCGLMSRLLGRQRVRAGARQVYPVGRQERGGPESVCIGWDFADCSLV